MEEWKDPAAVAFDPSAQSAFHVTQATRNSASKGPIRRNLGSIIALALLLLLSFVVQFFGDSIPFFSESPSPAMALGNASLCLDMTVQELLDQGFFLLDTEGNRMDAAVWEMPANSADTESFYTLGHSDSDRGTATVIRIYNPGRKAVPLTECQVFWIQFDFSPYAKQGFPIRVNDVDYTGMNALDAMKALVGTDSLQMNEFGYRSQPSRCTFQGGPYSYTLHFYASNTKLRQMEIALYMNLFDGK